VSARLLFCVSGHGYGHATRSAAILQELLLLRSDLEVTVSSSVPARFFEAGKNPRVFWRGQNYEPGTIQKNCFEVDITRTCAAYGRFLDERGESLRAETAYLRDKGFDGVVADVPAVPLVAAAKAGIPAAAVWNFTWDWILEPLLADEKDERLRGLPALLREDYRSAGLDLRLPFSSPETTFDAVEDVPLVGRRARLSRQATRRLLGIETQDPRPLVLVATSGWDSSNWAPVRVQGCRDFRFLVIGDLPVKLATEVRRLPVDLGEGYTFPDILSACDAVVSKPGYGLASECVLNQTALLGVERRGFREAAELVRGMKALGRFEGITLDDFFAGRWEPSLASLLGNKWVEKPVPQDGARIVAKRLCEYFGL